MTVRAIMTTPVITATRTTSVQDLVRLMAEHSVGGIPIVDPGDVLVGLVTSLDVVEKHMKIQMPAYLGILGGILPFGVGRAEDEIEHALATTAEEIMTEHPATVTPDTSIDDAATVMVESKLNPIPVVEGNHLVGILSRGDIIKLMLVEETGNA